MTKIDLARKLFVISVSILFSLCLSINVIEAKNVTNTQSVVTKGVVSTQKVTTKSTKKTSKTKKKKTFSLNKSSASIYRGNTYTLKTSNANGKVTWRTSNSSVASVNSKGVVTAKKAGTAYIYAKNGKTTKKCKITVKNKPFTISKSSVTVYKGNTYTIKTSNASGKVTWRTSKSSVASVNSKGVVTAKKAGTAYIYAKNGKTTKKCKVTVKNKPYTLNQKTLTLFIQQSTKLTGSFYNVKNKKLTYQSSNTNVATVDGSGNVTGRGAGTATISVITSTGYKETSKVTVKKKFTLSLSSSSMKISVGERKTNGVSMNPYYGDEAISYSSSNPFVATVDGNGTVLGITPGTATIYVNSSQESKSYNVTVYRAVTRFSTNFIAHRGYHENYTENTMAAFQAAVNKGYYGIETDIQITKDGQFVLSHDNTLLRAFGIDMNVNNSTVQELKNATGGRIVTLEEFFEFMKDKKEVPFLELKTMINEEYPNLEDNIKAFLDILSNYDRTTKIVEKVNVYVTSFDTQYLDTVRELDENIKIQFITQSTYVDINYLKKQNYGLDWKFSCANYSTVQMLKNNGINVCLWVIDNQYDAAVAVDWGTNSITTNKHYFN